MVQAGDERLTYVVTPDGVAQFDGNAIGDYVIKNPIKPGAEWAVAGGRARIASANEELNIDSVGRYAGCVVVEVTRAESGAHHAHGVRARPRPGRPRDAGAGGAEVRDQGAGAAARGHQARGRRWRHPNDADRRTNGSLATPAERWYVRGG